MYHKGDLEYTKDSVYMSDPREEGGYADGFLKPPIVYLPHSCGSWIIGGLNHARQLVADLREAITRMEGDIAIPDDQGNEFASRGPHVP